MLILIFAACQMLHKILDAVDFCALQYLEFLLLLKFHNHKDLDGLYFRRAQAEAIKTGHRAQTRWSDI